MDLLKLLQTGGAQDKQWDPVRKGKPNPAADFGWKPGVSLMELAQQGHPLAMYKVDGKGNVKALQTDSKMGLGFIAPPGNVGQSRETWMYLVRKDGKPYDPEKPPNASELMPVTFGEAQAMKERK